MTSLKQAANQLSPMKRGRPTKLGNAGYDNSRENIDPHIKTKVISGQEYYTGKARITHDGAICIKLTNKSGANSVKGEVVETSALTANAVALADANALDAIGIFYDSGIPDGEEAWIAVSGMVDVRMDAGGCALHDRIITSAPPGRGFVSNTPAVAAHFQEIGHSIGIAAANGTCKVVLHFL